MSRPPGHRDDREIRQCIEEFAHGAKQEDLAAKYGVTQPTISYWVNTFGEKVMGKKFKFRKQGRPQQKEPSARDKDIIAAVAKGTKYAELAAKYGITTARIGAICSLWVGRGYRPSA
jgi:Mor family transcriptional regulator